MEDLPFLDDFPHFNLHFWAISQPPRLIAEG
jgi:hypothetical protein